MIETYKRREMFNRVIYWQRAAANSHRDMMFAMRKSRSPVTIKALQSISRRVSRRALEELEALLSIDAG